MHRLSARKLEHNLTVVAETYAISTYAYITTSLKTSSNVSPHNSLSDSQSAYVGLQAGVGSADADKRVELPGTQYTALRGMSLSARHQCVALPFLIYLGTFTPITAHESRWLCLMQQWLGI